MLLIWIPNANDNLPGSTTYSTWLRMDLLLDIQILKTIDQGKNRLYKRKLEIATQSSYMWVKPMSELWGLVYIESHVTLQVKAEAQKVNYICLLHSFVLVLLQYEILYFLHSYVIRSVPQELYIFHGRLKLSWFFKPGMFSVKVKTTSVNRIPQKTSLARRAS